MHDIRSVAVRTGVAGGVAFFLHALIPYSRSYPFIWPVLAGAAAFWIATNDAHDAVTRRILRGMLTTLIAGLILGVVGFVGSTLGVVVILRFPAMRALVDSVGAGGRPLITVAAVLGIGIVSVIAIGVTLVGGLAMIPVRLVQAWRTNTTATR